VRFDRSDLHDDVPAETAITHIDDLKCAAPNEPKRPKIRKANSPAVRYQFANEPISESLHEGHRFTSLFSGKAIAKNKIGILGCCDHKIEIVQIIAAIGIAKKNPSNAARNIFQSAAACLPISTFGLEEDFCAGCTSAVGCCVRAAIVDDANMLEAAPAQIQDNIFDRGFLV
jgi:hypothetical protein